MTFTMHNGKIKLEEILGLILDMYSIQKPELQYMHSKKVSSRCLCYTEPGFALVITADGNVFPKSKAFPIYKAVVGQIWICYTSGNLEKSTKVTVIKTWSLFQVELLGYFHCCGSELLFAAV